MEYGIEDWGTYGEDHLGEHFDGAGSAYHYGISKDHDGFDDGQGPLNGPGEGPLTTDEQIQRLAETMLHERLHHQFPSWSHGAIREEAERCT